jgi:hypothetical protein
MATIWTQESDISQKKFAVSFLTSSKASASIKIPGYDIRHEIFNRLPASIGTLPVTKHMSPPYLTDKRGMLVPFQYSIVIENAYRHNYFTEKLLDCFATKTLPIYWGCPESDPLCDGRPKKQNNPDAYKGVSEFFNTDGVLTFGSRYDSLEKVFLPLTPGGSYDSLEKVLLSLTPELYASKAAAIEENYQKALTYADRTGNVARAIIDSWTPKITVYSGAPNVPPQS